MSITKKFCRALAGTKDVSSGHAVRPTGEIGGDVRQPGTTDMLPKENLPPASS